MKKRITVLYLAVIIAFIAFSSKLFYWQIVKSKELSKQAKAQHALGENVQAPRGNILASDGSWLAAKGDSYTVYAEIPNLKNSPKEVANKIAPLLLKEDELEDKTILLQEIQRIEDVLARKEVVWVPIKRDVLPDIKKNIEILEIPGIGFEKTETRIYPEASSAAHILGFVGKKEDGTDTGYFGLEGYYNLSLQGKPGFLENEKDALGRPITLKDSKEVSAIGGVDLLTHIDKTIQILLEEKLKEGLERYGAVSGSVIVMNPSDGGILGMASFPSFDPGEYWKYSNELFANPVVSSSFEPGSVFKVVVMASALDCGAVKPETICEVCDGPYKVDKYSIETWNNEYYPDSNMVDVIVHSDNVGMSFVSEKIGVERMNQYLGKFGFGKLTNIDLQGEFTPRIREEKDWNIVDLATSSFGQGIAVTPIQLIKSVAVIANDGVDVTPQVVDKLQSPSWNHNINSQIGERIISKQAAEDITSMMVEAAKNGEAKWTFSQGFRVAGKTGTAQIPISGHYDEEKTIASFIGFAPADDPKFVMLVTLREPQSSPWASETAAPLWYAIAKDLFGYFKIQPEN